MAALAQERSPESPFTQAIGHFSKRYIGMLLVIFILMGIIAFYQGRPVAEIAASTRRFILMLRAGVASTRSGWNCAVIGVSPAPAERPR